MAEKPRGWVLPVSIIITAIVVGAAVAVTIPAITPPAAERTVTQTTTRTATQTTTRTATETVTAERTVERTSTVRTTVTATVTATVAPTPPPKPKLVIAEAGSSRAFNTFIIELTTRFLRQMGYEVELPLLGVRTSVASFLAKEVPVTQNGYSELGPALEAGEPFVGFGPGRALAYVLAARTDVGSLKDLEGRTVGISRPGAISDVIPRFMLSQAGVDLDTVTWVAIGGTGARASALVAGRIDAGMVYSDVGLRLEMEQPGEIYILARVADVTGGLKPDSGWLFAYRDWLEANPEVAKDILRAKMAAGLWAYYNRDAYITEAMTWVEGEFKPELKPFYEELYDFLLPNDQVAYLRVDPREIGLVLQWNVETETTTRVLPLEQVWEPKYLNEVIAEMYQSQWYMP